MGIYLLLLNYQSWKDEDADDVLEELTVEELQALQEDMEEGYSQDEEAEEER